MVDDGSGDGTADVLATTYGDAIRIVGPPNGGAARARTTGILQASGELVAFLDSDDVWDQEKLAALDMRHIRVIRRAVEW